MDKFIFPTMEQIYGENKVKQLEVFKKYGTKCAITDFAILLGGYFSDSNYTNNSQDLKDRTGWWWSASHNDYGNVRVVDDGGTERWSTPVRRSVASRPASLFSDISRIPSNGVRVSNGIIEAEYGEYPQYTVDKNTSETLEREFQSRRLKTTGKNYTTDSVSYNSYNTGFQAGQHIEYEYNGEKYVRVKANTYYDGNEITLSNGEKYKDGDFVWVGVQPIKWLIDEKAQMVIAKNALFAGVQFNSSNSYDGNLANSDIKRFMDNHFAKDIKLTRSLGTTVNQGYSLKKVKEFTFLTEDQLFGNNQLEVLKKYGMKAAITDFAIVLGGKVSDSNYSLEGNDLKNRTGWWWSASRIDYDIVRVVDDGGTRKWNYPYRRNGASRPASPFSDISGISPNGVRGHNGILQIYYGEYPQMIVEKMLSETLEREFQSCRLKTTGKNYTTDSRQYNDYNNGFQPRTHVEYEYNGKKYIRAIYLDSTNEKLSDGRTITKNDAIWIEVQPVEWLIDEKSKTLIAKKCLFAGVRFNPKGAYDGNFKNTEIKKFMDDYFTNDLVSNRTFEQTTEFVDEVLNEQLTTKKINPYNFTFEDVTEEDIIKGSVQSGVAVFLHGASSEGKSARVKQLDPDLEIIYLRNASPDSLNGKSVVVDNGELSAEVIQIQKITNDLIAKVDSGEITLEQYTSELAKLPKRTPEMFDIPPTWYKKLKLKCDAEPNKIHIVFFDEITNALPSIQGMAYNIVLDREVNGIWKLPPNARIVAAGNEMKDSMAANQLAEPLFNRFAHVYIHTTVEDWLEWATTPEEEYRRLDYDESKPEMKIHPAIISYIAYKREDGLRRKYTGEKPNADPRKWELASKVLYKTRNPGMLRALVGEDLTIDFVDFCNQQVITLEDVVNGNYDEGIFDMDVSQRWATANGLLSATEANISKVSEFVEKLGSEYSAMYYRLWSGSNEKRKEIVADIIIETKSGGKAL